MDDSDEQTSLAGPDSGLKELLGLFDVPAFARRGYEVEYAVGRLDARCRRERSAMLEMVRLRLRQWASAAAGPRSAGLVFEAAIDGLWPAAEAPEPAWSGRDAPDRRLRAVARDLAASVDRFNRRWSDFVAGLDLGPINRMVERYNRYYLLEKECSLGSARLASRSFVPKPVLSAAALLRDHPLVPRPEVRP